MTRILVLNYEYPPLGGGAATQAKYLAEGLACKGHQVTVLTSRVIGADTVDASTDALEIVRVPSYRGQHGRNAILGMITFASFAFFRLFSLMKKHHPDICICFFGIPCGPIALWLKAIYHAPYVLCLRGGDVPGSNQALEKTHRRIRLLNRLVWREAMQVTVNSKKLKRQARSFYSKIDYQTVLNGIATGRFRPLNIERDKAFLYVGRLAVDKNVEWLIEQVMPAVLSRHPDFKLTVVGDGPLKDKLFRKCQNSEHMRDTIFTGWVDRSELPFLYNKHMFLIHPSISEGMSNVLMEAKACGLTCIGLDVPENRELLEKGRDLIADETNFIDAIDLFLEKTHRIDVSSDFLAKFSINRLIQHYEEIISNRDA